MTINQCLSARIKPIVALIILATGGVLAYDYASYIYIRPLYENRETIIEIPEGESFGAIATKLERIKMSEQTVQDTLFPRLYILLYGRLSNIEHRVKAGEYKIARGMTINAFFNRAIKGDSVYHSITIPEGVTFADLLEAIRQHPNIELSSDISGLMRQNFPTAIPPEGWFFPDTYHFHNKSDGIEILKKSHQSMRQILQKQWDTRDPDIPLKSPYEALILASIIEKEARIKDEKALIAAVFLNRLRKNMRLEADPTVIYGLGETFNGNLTRKHLRSDTPYNTYTRKGLPPTPIALPGEDTIYAATHPVRSSALYFVSRGDGSHHFSETYKEHQQAVDKYQKNRKK